MNDIEHLTRNSELIEKKIGYTFKDRSLLALAFVHRSYINENRHIHAHNERLEFLGDSVLGLLISEYAYRSLPDSPEGDLSNLRSKLVEASACIGYIHKLNLEKYLLLGKGERMNNGRGRDSILANLFEALIGAIYLDGGLMAANYFLFLNFSEEIDAALERPMKNAKAILQDLCQRKFLQTPNYLLLQEFGPDHNKQFEIAAVVNEKELGRGCGGSKKEAQQAAATAALAFLKATFQCEL